VSIRRSVALVLAGAGFYSVGVSAAFAQQILTETIEVRVANIDVVVRDRQGKSVSGLGKDDFELAEDGVPQTITNIYEVRRGDDGDAAGVPLELRQRRVVLFVDTTSLTPARRQAVLASIVRFFDKTWRPEDRAMLVAWQLGARVVTPFTNDMNELKRGLETIGRVASGGESSQRAVSNLRRNIEDLYDTAENEEERQRPMVSWAEAHRLSRSLVERYSEQLVAQQERMLDAVRDVTDGMAGLEGKKVLVFIGENLPHRPGAELYRYVHDRYAPHLNLNTPIELGIVSGVPGHSMPSRIEQLARDASANGVIIYSIGAAPSDADVSSENSLETSHGYVFTRDANTSAALDALAGITGGMSITRASNFDLAFDTIDRDLSSYYSIGYRPAGESRRQHRIVVRTKNRLYTARARQTFTTKSSDDQMADRAIANLYVDPNHNDWLISVRTGTPQGESGRFVVPVEVVIPSTVTLIPHEGNLAGRLTLYFVVGNGAGGLSPVIRRHQDIRIPPSAETLARAKPMMFRTGIGVNGGESILSVGIVDQLSGATGFTRARIVANP
jgi:VWFA-related protein